MALAVLPEGKGKGKVHAYYITKLYKELFLYRHKHKQNLHKKIISAMRQCHVMVHMPTLATLWPVTGPWYCQCGHITSIA